MSLIHCERCGRNTRLLAKGLCSKGYHYLYYMEQSQNVCVDCGKSICKESTRCLYCSGIARRKVNYHCIDCGAEVYRGSLRCRKCHLTYTKTAIFRRLQSEVLSAAWERIGTQPKSYCVECGREITQGATRCYDCFKIYEKTDECRQLRSKSVSRYYETNDHVMKGRSLPEEWCSNIGKAKKKHWAAGVYDDVFNSPSQPESDLMDILEELDIEYISQYRIKTYLYDVYLPAHNMLIEYDGWFWHYSEWARENGLVERNVIKDNLAKKVGLELVRLEGLPKRDLTKEEIKVILQDNGIGNALGHERIA